MRETKQGSISCLTDWVNELAATKKIFFRSLWINIFCAEYAETNITSYSRKTQLDSIRRYNLQKGRLGIPTCIYNMKQNLQLSKYCRSGTQNAQI